MKKEQNRNNKEQRIKFDTLLQELSQVERIKEDNFSLEESAIVDQLLQENLRNEFSYEIPEDFADRVCDKIEERSFLREGIEKHLLMTLGFLGIPGIAIGLLYHTKSSLYAPISEFLVEFKWPLLFGLFCLAAIQMADLYLVKSKEKIN
ncbi:MAG: hypothetical protein ACEPOZ_03770 [Marinifilaceae bacterium]